MFRISDITIGDFWGIENAAGFFENVNLGISLCIINTQQGSRLFEKVKPNLMWERRDISETLAKQPHLSCDEDGVPIKAVEAARQMYAEKGFLYIASKYGENGICGIYPKGVRFIRHIRNKVLKKMGFKTERRKDDDN